MLDDMEKLSLQVSHFIQEFFQGFPSVYIHLCGLPYSCCEVCAIYGLFLRFTGQERIQNPVKHVR